MIKLKLSYNNGNKIFNINTNFRDNQFTFYKNIQKYRFGSGPGSTDFDPRVNYYHRLGLNESASEAEIKKAFYSLAKKYHPDSNQDKKLQTSNEEKFKEASNAYEILSDGNKKTQYDDMRKEYKNQFGGSHHGGFKNNESEHTYKYDYQEYEKRRKNQQQGGSAHKTGYNYYNPTNESGDQNEGFDHEGRKNFEERFKNFRDSYYQTKHKTDYNKNWSRSEQEQYRQYYDQEDFHFSNKWKSYDHYEQQYQKYQDEFYQQQREYFDNLQRKSKVKEEEALRYQQTGKIALRNGLMFFTILSSLAFILYQKTSQDNKFTYEKNNQKQISKCKAYGMTQKQKPVDSDIDSKLAERINKQIQQESQQKIKSTQL
ncbi:molecular chaperone [Stylonychia lemnae]|uniref:Molecular chaperone n=1 Tax=Stylonychia lemnae TaxID=5949 RepID=A0A078AKB4_STYLE|nr:molecular chaperone [Stylonychia lemnae]|eukprot:CDW81248.1 molecular chaperone [Stylonychia lemnae]